MSGPKDHLRGPQNSTWATHPSWQKVVDLTNSSQPSPAGTAAARERQVIPVVVSSSVEGMENEWKCVMTCHESRWVPMTSPIPSESSECPWWSVPWRTVRVQLLGFGTAWSSWFGPQVSFWSAELSAKGSKRYLSGNLVSFWSWHLLISYMKIKHKTTRTFVYRLNRCTTVKTWYIDNIDIH